jgi:hypothetical protein
MCPTANEAIFLLRRQTLIYGAIKLIGLKPQLLKADRHSKQHADQLTMMVNMNCKTKQELSPHCNIANPKKLRHTI